MTNKLQRAQSRILSQYPTATPSRQGERFVEYQLPDGRMVQLAAIDRLTDSAGQAIVTDWQAVVDGNWRWRAATSEYAVNVAQEFNNGQILRYTDVPTGAQLTLQPEPLQWINDLDQLEQIAIPTAVPPAVTDGNVIWPLAYGAGTQYEVNFDGDRLSKLLTLTAPPIVSIPAFVLAGANPALRVGYILQRSAGLEIWADGVLWDERAQNPVRGARAVEFRLSGQTVCQLAPPSVGEALPPGQALARGLPNIAYTLRRSGNSRFVEIRVPWSWLAGATYPVTIDPTVTPSVAANNRDGYEFNESGSVIVDGFGGENYVGSFDGTALDHAAMAFQLDVPQGATVSSAEISVEMRYNDAGASESNTIRWHCFDKDNASVWDTEQSPAEARDGGNLTTAYNERVYDNTTPSSGQYVVADIATAVEEVVSRAGWVANNYLAVAAVTQSPADACEFGWDDYSKSGGTPPQITVVYSTGGGGISIPVVIHHLRQQGLS